MVLLEGLLKTRARSAISLKSPTHTIIPRAVAPTDPVLTGASGARVEAVGRALQLAPEVVQQLLGAYVPLCRMIDNLRSSIGRPVVVGVGGAQGSGKTTLASFAGALLTHVHGRRVVRFSIDDFYRTRAEREELGRRVHPLLRTRGVPGTHDVELGIEILRALGDGRGPVTIPRFDKGIDDRAAPEAWSTVRDPVDVVLFEGWCVAAPPQGVDALEPPINALEAEEDPDGVWRKHVDEQLAGRYATWFEAIDCLIYLEVPDFEHVRTWRRLQEEKLRRSDPSAPYVMGRAELDRFLMLFERTTRNCLATLPDAAELVCRIDETHRIRRIDAALDPGPSADP